MDTPEANTIVMEQQVKASIRRLELSHFPGHVFSPPSPPSPPGRRGAPRNRKYGSKAHGIDGRVVSPECQIGYVEHTGCQLNRVLTAK
jgi:hypothetical protein